MVIHCKFGCVCYAAGYVKCCVCAKALADGAAAPFCVGFPVFDTPIDVMATPRLLNIRTNDEQATSTQYIHTQHTEYVCATHAY